MNSWRELDFGEDGPGHGELIIEDDRARLLADELRWRILETLSVPKTIGALADDLQVTDARVLYHVEKLVEASVVHLEQAGANPATWLCGPAASRLRVRVLLPEESADLIPEVVARQFNQAGREAAEGLYGSGHQISVNHNGARLSVEQAAEFSRRLLELIEEYFPPGKGDHSGIKYGFYGILTPIDLHPLGD